MAVHDLNPMTHAISLLGGFRSPHQNGNRELNDNNDKEGPEGIGENSIHKKIMHLTRLERRFPMRTEATPVRMSSTNRRFDILGR